MVFVGTETEMDLHMAQIENHLPEKVIFVVHFSDGEGVSVYPCSSWSKCAQVVSSIYGPGYYDSIEEDLELGHLIITQPPPDNFYTITNMWDKIIHDDQSYILSADDYKEEDHLQLINSLINLPSDKYVAFCHYSGMRVHPSYCYIYFTDIMFPEDFIYDPFEPHTYQLDESKPIIREGLTTYYFGNMKEARLAYHLLTTSVNNNSLT